jgi:hypothetical protein
MKLTRKKAIELGIELWTWLAETGKRKSEWPKWDEYSKARSNCWFCEYDDQMLDRYKCNRQGCGYCPLVTNGFGRCSDSLSLFEKWNAAKTPRTRKKYAKLFLGQIKTLK